MIGTFEILPPDANDPEDPPGRGARRRPLDFSRYAGRDDDRFVLRSATDELMYELMMLSGQEYVDEYAAKVKSGEVAIGSGDLDELGQLIDQGDDLIIPRAS
jgi:1-acyl-sn-glycerol-3-phosphate acyltransferase